MPTPERRWLSQAEAAERLGVTDRTIRNYIAAGHLAACHIRGTRTIRIDARELDQLLVPIPTVRGDAA